MLAEETGKFRRLQCVTREDGTRVCDAEVPYDDLAEDIPEIGRDREIAPFVPAIDREAGPLAVDVAAPDPAADDHHRVAVAVIRSAIAVLADRSPELRHRQDHGVFGPIAEVGDERGNRSREIV